MSEDKRKSKLEWLVQELSFLKTKAITRFALRGLIMASLDIVDKHTVNNWIVRLLAKGFISTRKPLEKPTNRTIYIINKEAIEEFLK